MIKAKGLNGVQYGAWKNREVSQFVPLGKLSKGDTRTPRVNWTIELMLDKIRTSEKLRTDTSKEQYSSAKTKYAGSVSICGTFSRLIRTGIVKGSGLIQLDFDDVEDIDGLRADLVGLPSVVLVSKSLSGKGLKAAVSVSPTPKTNAQVKSAFEAVVGSLPDALLKHLDRSVKNINREWFLAYDEDAWGYWDNESAQVEPIHWAMAEGWSKETFLEETYLKSEEEGSRHNAQLWMVCDMMRHGYSDEDILNACAEFRTNVNVPSKREVTEQESINALAMANDLRETGELGDPWRKQSSTSIMDLLEKKATMTHAEAVELCYGMTDLELADAKTLLKDRVSGFSVRAFKKGIKEKKKQIALSIRESKAVASGDREDYVFYEESFDENGNPFVEIYVEKIPVFMEWAGFFKREENGVYYYFRNKGGILHRQSKDSMSIFICQYAKEVGAYKGMMEKPSVYANIRVITQVKTVEPVYPDKADTWVYYKNTAIRVSASCIEEVAYEDISHDVYAENIMDREFHGASQEEVEASDFYKFHALLSGNNAVRMHHYRKVLGYLMGSDRSPEGGKVVVYQDQAMSEEANGGTGKSLAIQALSHMVAVCAIPADRIDFNDPNVFGPVIPDVHKVIAFDDAMNRFDLSALYTATTLGLNINAKYARARFIPTLKLPRIMVTTNITVKVKQDSDRRRTIFVEVDKYFGLKHTPKDEFGRMLFSGWSEQDWDAFDQFMLGCIQQYLSDPSWSYAVQSGEIGDLYTEESLWKQLASSTSFDFSNWVKNRPYQPFVMYDIAKEYDLFLEEADAEISLNAFSRWYKKAGPVVAKTLGKNEGRDTKSDSTPPFIYVKRQVGQSPNKKSMLWFGEDEKPSVRHNYK
jgi:hypothetical protein